MAPARLSRSLVSVAGASAVLAVAAPALAAAPTTGTTITSGPAAGSFVSSASATFGFNDKGHPSAAFTCKLDAATAASCTSPHTYNGLTQGKHTFTVTGTDAGTSTSATRSWTVDTVAPKPTIAAPTGLTAPVVIPFGEAVNARKGAALATLTLTDSGASVATTTTCWRGTTSVACASALFDSLRVKPSARLLAGQHYTAHVAAGVVIDRAGNANTAARKAFRAARTLQENAPGVAATWQTITSRSAAGGSFVREHLAGAAASWSFTGTGVTWWTVTGPAYGKADIYIDGVRKKTVNAYATSRHFNVARTVSGLANSSHRLRIVVLGLKGNKSGVGTFVAIDAFTVGGTKTSSPVLSTTWRRIAGSHLSAGHAAVSDLANATLRLTFRGTGITWYTVTGVNQGKAAVFVDGVRKATFDNYATSTSYGVQRVVGNLTDGIHTVKIVVLGKHHKGGKGNRVTVDRVRVA
jgi:hypothetical protein